MKKVLVASAIIASLIWLAIAWNLKQQDEDYPNGF
jgi:hypothetical protein